MNIIINTAWVSHTWELSLWVREERQGGGSVDAGSQGGGCGQTLTSSGGGTGGIKLDKCWFLVFIN